MYLQIWSAIIEYKKRWYSFGNKVVDDCWENDRIENCIRIGCDYLMYNLRKSSNIEIFSDILDIIGAFLTLIGSLCS